MRWRYLLVTGAVVSTLGLTGGLIGVGVDNINKQKQIDQRRIELQDTIYPVVPEESRILPKTGPSLPSPGYEN